MNGHKVKSLRKIVYRKWVSLDDKLKKINPFKCYFRRAKKSYTVGVLKIA